MEKKKKRRSQPPPVKHALTSPLQLQWPKIDDVVTDKITELLKSSFTDIKLQSAKKPRSERNKLRKDCRKRKSKHEVETTNEKILKLADDSIESKKNESVKVAPDISKTTSDKSSTLEITTHNAPSVGTNIITDVVKKNQFVVGINIVTRCLERDELRAGLICLSARPPLVTQHLMMLSATRECPMLALLNLSETLSPLLGINSVLAIGFKKLSSQDETDHFQNIVSFITDNACCMSLPWLYHKDYSPSSYLPLKVKALMPK